MTRMREESTPPNAGDMNERIFDFVKPSKSEDTNVCYRLFSYLYAGSTLTFLQRIYLLYLLNVQYPSPFNDETNPSLHQHDCIHKKEGQARIQRHFVGTQMHQHDPCGECRSTRSRQLRPSRRSHGMCSHGTPVVGRSDEVLE